MPNTTTATTASTAKAKSKAATSGATKPPALPKAPTADRVSELNIAVHQLPRYRREGPTKGSPADSLASTPPAECVEYFEVYFREHAEVLALLSEAKEAVQIHSQPLTFKPSKGQNLLFDSLTAQLDAADNEQRRVAILALARTKVEELERQEVWLRGCRDYLAVRADLVDGERAMVASVKKYNAARAALLEAQDKMTAAFDTHLAAPIQRAKQAAFPAQLHLQRPSDLNIPEAKCDPQSGGFTLRE